MYRSLVFDRNIWNQMKNDNQIGMFIIIDHIYPTPPLGQDMTQGQFFKRSVTDLNSEFSFF